MKSDKEDIDLIAGCLKNDRICQQKLYNKYSGKMLGLCMRYAKNKEEAEDYMIEGFMKVFTSLNTFNRKSSFETWMRSIMIHNAISNYRKNVQNRLVDSMEDDSFISEVDFPFDGIPASLSSKELMQIIQEMPETLRYVLNLVAFEGLGYEQVATELSVTETTVRARMSKAKRWLSDRIFPIKDEKR